MQDCGHTLEWTGPTVERILSNGKRVWALAFRRWLVEQARKPDASLAGLALKHGLNANLLRHWMAVDGQMRESATLLPVTLELPETIEPPTSARVTPGHIELEVHGARLTLHGEIDASRLRIVLDALARRR